VAATPQGHATPEPDIATVEERVDHLYHQAEQAAERFNTVRNDLRVARQQLSALEADVDSQQEVVDQLGDEVGDIVAAQVQATPAGPTSQLISSGDADSFLSGLAAMQAYNVKQANVLDSLDAQQAELDLRLAQKEEQVATIEQAKSEMAKERDVIDEKYGAAQALLDELEAAELARVLEAQRSDVPQRVPDTDTDSDSDSDADADSDSDSDADADGGSASEVEASGNAQAAIDFAYAQLGDAYVYGATGPDAWDCSGLTMGAWGAAGVSLPHASSVQAGMGTSVSYDAMQPGDLVFYYSPISHVGIYVGNGQLIHAPNPSSVVEIVDVDLMPVASIRRVG
jgi:cell wall-associated NlpC family hydrolase